jgi:hypothetical protein
VRHFSSATTCVVERQWLRVVYRHALATYLLGTVHCICQVSHPISARTVGTVAMVYVGYASGRLTLSTSMMIKKSLLHFFFEVRFLVSIPHFHLIPKSLSLHPPGPEKRRHGQNKVAWAPRPRPFSIPRSAGPRPNTYRTPPFILASPQGFYSYTSVFFPSHALDLDRRQKGLAPAARQESNTGL